ncbi:MAG TPA: 16S rRNA (cytosine(967)-C(5))-methyltransferase RsmB [Rhodocyclaceae bacterium]|nr:16S rRNA (cytosine(967)-C(5))-methyltransferase RsmB [Rhodocyclaceae bacterium]
MTHATPHLPADSLAFAFLRAAEVLASVLDGRTLDAALAACWQKHKPQPPMRGAIQDLAYGTLRAGERGDFVLSQLLRSPLADTQMRCLLLAALYRLDSRPEDSHTTVDQAVTAAATLAHGKYRALGNAVLRNALRQRESIQSQINADEPALWQHPAWWIAAVKKAYPAQWQSILTAANSHPPMTLRVNRRHGDATAYIARLAELGIGARALDDTAVLLERPLNVDGLPGFAEGHASVQDWGAQQAARLLNAQAGMRVLDACAAPGGKTAHILELADVDLTALELDPKRAQRIHENLQRIGRPATVKTADCANLAAWWDGQPFERILADVPCSASGVARRHPDIKWLRRKNDIGSFATTQQRILDALWQTLAPGGTMLYCTCSIFPQENGEQLAAFVERHADAQRMEIDGQPELQLTPSPEQDGFYYALLQKTR